MLSGDNYAVCYQKDAVVTEVREKEPIKDRFAEYVSTGTYYFKSGAILKKYFQELISLDINIKGEYYVSLVYNLMVRDGLKVNVTEVENVINLGTPTDYEEYKNWSDCLGGLGRAKQKYSASYCHGEDTTLIVPMAGFGKRCNDYTLPKPLIELDGLPMFVRAVNSAPKVNNKIFIILKEHVEKFNIHKVVDKFFPKAKVLVLDDVTQGQACTCELAIKTYGLDLDKPILISSSDNGVVYNAGEYARLVNLGDFSINKLYSVSKEESIADVIVWSFRHNQTSRVNKSSYSWLEVDKDNFLIKEYSKFYPFGDDSPLKHHAIIGTMFFRKARYFMDALAQNYKNNVRTNGEFYVDDLLNPCLKELRVKVFEADHFLCWGTNNDIKTYLYYKNYFNKKYG